MHWMWCIHMRHLCCILCISCRVHVWHELCRLRVGGNVSIECVMYACFWCHICWIASMSTYRSGMTWMPACIAFVVELFFYRASRERRSCDIGLHALLSTRCMMQCMRGKLWRVATAAVVGDLIVPDRTREIIVQLQGCTLAGAHNLLEHYRGYCSRD